MRTCLVALGFAALIGIGAGCKGIRTTDEGFVAHGVAFRPLGLVAIPEDDMAVAFSQVPQGATVTDVYAPPTDWTSITGILHNIFVWVDVSTVSGTK